jgi:hypothetical protein
MMKEKPAPAKKAAQSGKKEISLLINSAYYFIECVYISRLDDGFRLIALHQGTVLMDAIYETARGARIAFSRLYKNRTWKEGVKAEWTNFYSPGIQ